MTSERTSAPERQSGFDSNPALDATIEAKIEAALDLNPNIVNPTGITEDALKALIDGIPFTDEEHAYLSKRGLQDLVQATLGERIMQILAAARFNLHKPDIIPALSAYFAAVEDGTMEAVQAAPAALAEPTVDTWNARHQTEAEGLYNVLSDLGLNPSVIFGRPDMLVFGLGDGVKPSALDVAMIAEERFFGDPEFKEDFITAVGNMTDFYVKAPGIDATLRTADAATVVAAVSKAGFSPLVLDWDTGDGLGKQLVFNRDINAERDLAAIDLIDLLEKRYREEPDFAAQVRVHILSEGPHLIFSA